MSAIRPDLPSIPPSGPVQPAAPSAVKNAQAAFFRAALSGVETPPPAVVEARSAQPAPRPADPEGVRPTRPGSLLDIRV